MKPTDNQVLRQKIGQLFEQLPKLENIELAHGGQRYRAERAAPWVLMDTKAARGWDRWTEWPLPEYHQWKARREPQP